MKFKLLYLVSILFHFAYAAEVLNIGIHNSISGYNNSQKDFYLAMNVFTKAIANEVGIDYNVQYYDDATILAKDFKDNKLNSIIAEPLTVVKYIDKNLLSSGIIGYKKDKIASQTIILLGRKEDTRSLKEKLANGTLIYNGDPSVALYSKLLGREHGVDNINFSVSKNTQQSILKLFFKKADLAAVDLSSFSVANELNPQLQQKLSILKMISGVPTRYIGFLRAGMNKSLQDKILSIVPTFNDTTRGRQLLYLFQSGNVGITNPHDLDKLREMYNKF